MSARESGFNGWLYFIRATESGRVKIGRSNDPHRRLATFQTASPEPLELVAILPQTPELDEARAHTLWAEDRVHGEWFDPSPAFVVWLQDMVTRDYLDAEHRRRQLRDAGMADDPCMTTEQAVEIIQGHSEGRTR